MIQQNKQRLLIENEGLPAAEPRPIRVKFQLSPEQRRRALEGMKDSKPKGDEPESSEPWGV